jgi:hypothetical protein
MATDLEWAWAAGLFEGEGCISYTGKNSVTLSLGMTDRDVIDRFAAVAGCGSIAVQAHHRSKTLYRWHIGDQDRVREILGRLEPWLGQRRRERMIGAWERLSRVRRKGFCKRGHPMSGENTYTSPKGQVFCRTCLRSREAARRPRPYVPTGRPPGRPKRTENDSP